MGASTGIHVAVIGASGLAEALQHSGRFEAVHRFQTTSQFRSGIANLASLPPERLTFLFADNTPNDLENTTIGDLVGRLTMKNYRVAVVECSAHGRTIVTQHPGAGLIPSPVTLNIVLGALSDRGVGMIEPVSEPWAYETLDVTNPGAVDVAKSATGSKAPEAFADVFAPLASAPAFSEPQTQPVPQSWGGQPAAPAAAPTWGEQPQTAMPAAPWGEQTSAPAAAPVWGEQTSAPAAAPTWGEQTSAPLWGEQPQNAMPAAPWGEQPAAPAAAPVWGEQTSAPAAAPTWGEQPVSPSPWGGQSQNAMPAAPWGEQTSAPAAAQTWGEQTSAPLWGEQPQNAMPAAPWGEQPAAPAAAPVWGEQTSAPAAAPTWGEQPVSPSPWGGQTQNAMPAAPWGEQTSAPAAAQTWGEQPAAPVWGEQPQNAMPAAPWGEQQAPAWGDQGGHPSGSAPQGGFAPGADTWSPQGTWPQQTSDTTAAASPSAWPTQPGAPTWQQTDPQGGGWSQQAAAPQYAMPTSRRKGFVISVAVAKGGAGKSSLTLNLGVWLGLRLRATGGNVCIVDANWQQADIGKQINAYNPTIYGLSQHQDDLRPDRIAGHLYTRQDLGNTSFLLGPVRTEEANPLWITPKLYSQAVETLRHLFDYIIIDTPVAELHHDLFDDFVLPQSDYLVVPVIPNWPTIINTDNWLRQITLPVNQGGKGFDERRVGIILNRADADIGFDEHDVETELGSWDYLGAIPNSNVWTRAGIENEIVATRNYPEINNAFGPILNRVTGEAVLLEGLGEQGARPTKKKWPWKR